MQRLANRIPSPPAVVRAALAAFVLAWIFGPYELRVAVPVWLVFLVALALEVHFFLGMLGRPPAPRPDRGPQPVDRDLYGYRFDTWEPPLATGEAEEDEADEEDEELWDEDEDDWDDERRSIWMPVRRFLVGLAVIGALGLVIWLVESRTGWNGLSADTRAEAQERFSEEASVIAGKPVRIRCDEEGAYVGAVQHADGVAVVGGDLAYLTPERCIDLYRLAFEGETTGSQTGRALAVLAHEAWHLRGVRNEGETECYAVQSGVGLGQRLGLSEDAARRLMRQQLVENAGRGAGSLEYVVPAECRDGGRLDLDPDSTRFP